MYVSTRLLLALLAAFAALPFGPPAEAQPRQTAARRPPAQPGGPKAIGTFEDWTAATYEEAGQTVCYAFVRASNSAPALSGRSKPVLTVTQRSSARDAVALSAGFRYPQGAEVTVQVEQSALSFHTSGSSAFAREGGAAVSAFQRGRQVFARSPGPRGSPVITDTFSLRGFSQAYQAINKACSR
jgi:hypothetical protein